MPIRGNRRIAIHVSKLWQLVQQMQRLELETFGVHLAEYRTELKGSKLLNRYRFKWAAQSDRMPDEEAYAKTTSTCWSDSSISWNRRRNMACSCSTLLTEGLTSSSKTLTGRYRASWIVPVPLFVSSEMTYPIQAADMVVYCVNWGFRIGGIGMTAPMRPEIADRFGPWLNQLQYVGQGYRDGRVFESFGICCVPDPYEGGAKKERRQSP